MTIIHGMKTLPRQVGAALSDRLRVMPAVVVTGARQTAKSALVEQLFAGKRRYATLDAGWRDARVERADLGYWRTSVGEEVDFVIEAVGRLLPIEVKSTARPRLSDAAPWWAVL